MAPKPVLRFFTNLHVLCNCFLLAIHGLLVYYMSLLPVIPCLFIAQMHITLWHEHAPMGAHALCFACLVNKHNKPVICPIIPHQHRSLGLAALSRVCPQL